MATLPTPVAEHFLFMLPTDKGPGLYAPMVLMLGSLMSDSILHGTFAKVINKFLQAKYPETHVSYLDAIVGWMEQPPVEVTYSVLMPFSPFYKQSGNYEVKLKLSLVKEAL